MIKKTVRSRERPAVQIAQGTREFRRNYCFLTPRGIRGIHRNRRGEKLKSTRARHEKSSVHRLPTSRSTPL